MFTMFLSTRFFYTEMILNAIDSEEDKSSDM